MSSPSPSPSSENELTSPAEEVQPNGENLSSEESGLAAKVIYILFIVGLMMGLSALVGLIAAYVYRSPTQSWVNSHYQFQIRTFWIGLLFIVITAFTLPIGIGYVLWLLFIIWVLIRCIKGLSAAGKKQPITNVKTWWV